MAAIEVVGISVDFAINFSCCIFFPHLGTDYNMAPAKLEAKADPAATPSIQLLEPAASFTRTVNSTKLRIRVGNIDSLSNVALHRMGAERHIDSFVLIQICLKLIVISIFELIGFLL